MLHRPRLGDLFESERHALLDLPNDGCYWKRSRLLKPLPKVGPCYGSWAYRRLYETTIAVSNVRIPPPPIGDVALELGVGPGVVLNSPEPTIGPLARSQHFRIVRVHFLIY